MKTVAISGSIRTSVGKKDAKALRVSGLVPCILYGGTEQVSFAVPERDFKSLVYTPDVHVVELELGGKNYNAVMKELQLHPVTDKIMHVDFLEVITGKAVTMALPVKFEGTAPGVRSGGKLIRKMRKITVRGPVEKIPEAITLDVSKLEIGDAIRVSDVTVDGLTLLDIPNNTVVTVRVTRNVVEEAKPGTAAAAPAAAKAAPAADAKKPAEKKK
ncbi:50S ribosomal protein L25/general stress protein Ctc [soil metagenome]